MKQIIALIVLITLTSGCRIVGGFPKSVHIQKEWTTNGVLVRYDKQMDRNPIFAQGVLSSDSATSFAHTRSNYLGTTGNTTVGSYIGKPDAEAIKATGDAVGTAGAALLKKTVAP
jgi:hypothetical protein